MNELINEMILVSIDGFQDALISCFTKGKKCEEDAAILKITSISSMELTDKIIDFLLHLFYQDINMFFMHYVISLNRFFDTLCLLKYFRTIIFIIN